MRRLTIPALLCCVLSGPVMAQTVYSISYPGSAPGSAPVGVQQTITGVFSDPNGAGSILQAQVQIATPPQSLPTCTVAYVYNSFYLFSDSGTALLGPIASNGTGGSLSNSSCTVTNPIASASGTQLTLTLPITFNQSFAGNKN